MVGHQVDQVDHWNADSLLNRIIVVMGGVAGNRQEIRPPCFEPSAHISHARAWIFAIPLDNGFYPGWHLGIIVHDTADMIGIVQCRSQADDALHQIDRGLRAHAP